MRFIAVILLLLPLAALAQAPPSIVPVSPPKKAAHAPIIAKILEAPKLDAIGVADGKADIWKGSTFEDIAALLARQNLGSPSVAAHKLLTRLLTIPAALEGKEDGLWLRLRLQTLLKMGEEKALKDMLAMVPADARGEWVERLLVEQELLTLNNDKACEKITQGIGKYKEVFWLQANAFCLAKNKKAAEADLALQLLREQKAESALPFEESIRKIMGDNAKIAPIKTFNLSPLELAVAIEAGLAFDPQIDKENGAITPAAARFLALNSKLSLTTRTQLAERAFRIGILPREQLEDLYKAASFKPEALAKAKKEKQFPAAGVDARALAFQINEKAPFPADLAQRLFSPDAPADGWKQIHPDENILVAAVYKAFGLPVDDVVWKKFATQKETTAGANAAALDGLKSKRVGETALLGLSLLPYSNNSVTLRAVLEAFRAVGLEKEASALAEEALLGHY